MVESGNESDMCTESTFRDGSVWEPLQSPQMLRRRPCWQSQFAILGLSLLLEAFVRGTKHLALLEIHSETISSSGDLGQRPYHFHSRANNVPTWLEPLHSVLDAIVNGLGITQGQRYWTRP